LDRNQIRKWFKEPAKMANKYSLHAIYFCTGCGIIEVPPVITSRWDAERFGVIPVAAQTGEFVPDHRVRLGKNFEGYHQDL